MKNTYWTKLEDGHYRVHNGMLKYAPNKKNSSSIDLDNVKEVNKVLKTDFHIEKFNL